MRLAPSGQERLPSVEWFSQISLRDFYAVNGTRFRHKVVQDCFYWDLSEQAIIQGKLLRRIKHLRGEIWREGWYMIVGSQLWMFALPSSDQSDSSLIFPPSFFDLSPANGSSLRFVDATSFSITIHEEVETFRARTVAEAKRWMLTLAGYFHRRMSAISPQFHAHGSKAAEDHSENMCFATLEQQIGDAAKRQAINRFQIVEQYYQFNGAMRQNSLRDSFRAHLRKINQHHLLLFWEYCEDYRRSHFSRSAPAAYSCDKYLLDESVSSSYYQAIRLAFLDASSPFFVSFSAEQSPDHLTSSSTVLCNAQHTALARLKDIFRSYSTSLVFKRKCQALHQVNDRPTAPKSSVSPSVQPKPSNLLSRFISKSQGTNTTTTTSSTGSGTASPNPSFFRKEALGKIRSKLLNGSVAGDGMPEWWWESEAIFDDSVTEIPSSASALSWQLVSMADALKTIDSIKHCCADITPAHHLSFAPISKADTSSPPEFQVKLEVGRAELLGELGSSVARLTDAPSHFTTGIGVVVMTSMMNTFCFPRPKVRSTLRIRGEEQGSGKKTGPVSSVRIDNLSLTPYRDSEIAPSTLSEHDDDGETFYTRTAAANIDLLSSGGTRLLAIATATLGNSHLFFLDPQSSKIISCFRLWEFVRVGPADSCLQGIEMIDDEGHSWQFHPEGIDEDDSQRLRLRWLQILWSIVRSPTTVYTIIKRGTLSKKGRVNKSFKPRFCELSSDLKLRYYKCDSGWTYKGQIDLILLDRFTIGKTGDVTRFEQLICLSMQRANRVWVLKADSESEAQEWELAINDLLQVWGGKDSAAMASLPRNPERTSEGASSDDGT